MSQLLRVLCLLEARASSPLSQNYLCALSLISVCPSGYAVLVDWFSTSGTQTGTWPGKFRFYKWYLNRNLTRNGWFPTVHMFILVNICVHLKWTCVYSAIVKYVILYTSTKGSCWLRICISLVCLFGSWIELRVFVLSYIPTPFYFLFYLDTGFHKTTKLFRLGLNLQFSWLSVPEC